MQLSWVSILTVLLVDEPSDAKWATTMGYLLSVLQGRVPLHREIQEHTHDARHHFHRPT